MLDLLQILVQRKPDYNKKNTTGKDNGYFRIITNYFYNYFI